jgi:hypothetical protein
VAGGGLGGVLATRHSHTFLCVLFYDIPVENEYHLLAGWRQVYWQVRAGRGRNIVNG